MIPFVAGVLSGMALQKVLDGGTEKPMFEPVEMREVSEEHVKEILAKASKTIQGEKIHWKEYLSGKFHMTNFQNISAINWRLLIDKNF